MKKTEEKANYSASNIKAVLFDIDGTLYSNAFMFISAPCIYIRNILWFIRFAKMRKRLREGLVESDVPLDESVAHTFHKNAITIFSSIIKEEPAVAAILLQKHIYVAWIKAIGKVPLRLGMRKTIRNLKRKNIILGILSDFQSQEKIKNWKLECFFDIVVCAEDYGVLKPDKRIFALMGETLSLKAEEILFVGNHLTYDGLGAERAGMHSLLFYNHIKKLYTTYPHTSIKAFKTMQGLRHILQSYGL